MGQNISTYLLLLLSLIAPTLVAFGLILPPYGQWFALILWTFVLYQVLKNEFYPINNWKITSSYLEHNKLINETLYIVESQEVWLYFELFLFHNPKILISSALLSPEKLRDKNTLIPFVWRIANEVNKNILTRFFYVLLNSLKIKPSFLFKRFSNHIYLQQMSLYQPQEKLDLYLAIKNSMQYNRHPSQKGYVTQYLRLLPTEL